MLIFALVMVSYFIVTAGVAYDIINEPPAVGGTQDPITGVPVLPLFVQHCLPFSSKSNSSFLKVSHQAVLGKQERYAYIVPTNGSHE